MGLNGALTAVCGGIFGIVSFVVVVGPSAVGNPEGQALARLHAVVFALVFFPVTVVASYFGGKVEEASARDRRPERSSKPATE